MSEELVEDYAVKLYREYRENNGMDADPDFNNCALVTAQDLSPMAHVVMQASVQRWIDSSISKTINCPEDIDFEAFKDVYMTVWETGCKGCTTYRPNDVTGSVLSVESDPKPEAPEEPETAEQASETALQVTQPYARPHELTGQTYKIKWENSNIYVTINNSWDEHGNVMPFEIFINSKKMEHFQWTVALTRMISAVFRRGGDISFVTEELKNVFDPNGGTWVNGRYVPSLIALLGQTIEKHLDNISYGDGPDEFFAQTEREEPTEETEPDETAPDQKPDQCPECGSFAVVKLSGCPTCQDCGHSKCG
jgi:ribonucleoside-diphosphate reductase alpha chain